MVRFQAGGDQAVLRHDLFLDDVWLGEPQRVGVEPSGTGWVVRRRDRSGAPAEPRFLFWKRLRVDPDP
mgnify:CR=1 FL=1